MYWVFRQGTWITERIWLVESWHLGEPTFLLSTADVNEVNLRQYFIMNCFNTGISFPFNILISHLPLAAWRSEIEKNYIFSKVLQIHTIQKTIWIKYLFKIGLINEGTNWTHNHLIKKKELKRFEMSKEELKIALTLVKLCSLFTVSSFRGNKMCPSSV